MPQEEIKEVKQEEEKIEEQVAAAGEQAGKEAEQKGASPDEVKAVVEKARKEGKDKLYPQLEALRASMKDIQETLKAEREEKEKIQKEATEKAEAERQTKLSDQERIAEVLAKLEEQLKNEQAERKRFEKALEKKTRENEVASYKAKLISENSDEIIPELVTGSSEEELDEALDIAKARFKEYEERFKQAKGDNVRRQMSRSTNPDYQEALEELELSKDLTAVDADKYLKDEDYRKRVKAELENEYARLSGRI